MATFSRPGSRRRRATAALMAILLLTGGTTAATQTLGTSQAFAASQGPAIQITSAGTTLGSIYRSDGTQVYCLELFRMFDMGSAEPVLATTASLPGGTGGFYSADLGMNGPVTASQPAVTGSLLNQLRFVLGKYGITADNEQAAAVQLAVWSIRGIGADAGYQQILDLFRTTTVSAGYAHVMANADAMIAEAATWDGASTSAPASPYITIGATPYTGTVHVDAGTTSLTITNGIFTANGAATYAWPDGAAAGTSLQFEGRPTLDDESWDRYYRVTINGSYRYEAIGAMELADGTGIQQDTGWTPGEVRSGDFDAVYLDPDTLWAPALSTQVPSMFVAEGSTFSDTVTFFANDQVGSGIWRWQYNSAGTARYAPITATGTLFGPFLSDPALNPSGAPPVGAPVVGTVRVTTDSGRDHSQPQTYQVETDLVSEEAGYYSWVWTIDAAEQAASVVQPSGGQPSIPVDYYFTDGFGQASEGQITPSNIRFSTELSDTSVVIGDAFTDDVHVRLTHGGWLQDETGARTTFTLRGTAYLTAERPTQQPAAPADAEVLTTVFVTTNAPQQTVTSEAMTIPLTTRAGFVTVQWCLLDEDQTEPARGKATQWCDDFGAESETAQILRPEVTTQAQPEGTVKGDISDTAIVSGALPSNAITEVEFTAYLKPEAGAPKYDENWEVIIDAEGEPVLWTEDEVTDPASVCLAQPVGTTTRVPVSELGGAQSPPIRAGSAGTVYWVERLIITPPEGDGIVVHEGECGLPNETTLVVTPVVTTRANHEAVVGQEISDIAIIAGPLSDRPEISYELVFEAFHRADGTTTGPNESLCTPDTKVWESTESTPVDGPGEYMSEKWQTAGQHVGEILWVEMLTLVEETDEGATRSVVHRGACGAADEITRVIAPPVPVPPLAVTGGSFLPMLIVGGMGVLLLAAGVAVMVVRRRRLVAEISPRSHDTVSD